ncbi:MAG: hypothetical protein AAB907_04090 [Patescibacteria group bacterium]
MHAYILVSNSPSIIEKYISSFCAENKIASLDITSLKFINNEEKTKQSIGIEEVRIVQKNLSLKPIQSEQKLLVIYDAHLLTAQAQNALLKVLEDPPNNTIIILVSPSISTLLPTVISRCGVVELETTTTFDPKELEENLTVLNTLPTMAISNKLKLAQDISKDKEEAKLWLKKAIQALRNEILQASNKKSLANYHHALLALQDTYQTISSTNANPRLAIENLLLSLFVRRPLGS